MSAGSKQEYSSAASAAFDAFLQPFEAAFEVLMPRSLGTESGGLAARRRWAVATLLPVRGELEHVGNINLRRRSLADRRVRVDVHSTLEVLFHTVSTADGHLVCRDDRWSSLESWDVGIRQRFTRAAEKVDDQAFDRRCRGRVVDDTFEVAGRAGVSLPGGPVVSELAALESAAAMVEAPRVHVVRDFDALARQQHFEDLGVAGSPWGDLQVILQTGTASLPITYWLDSAGRAVIVRHGSRLWIERSPSAEWPGGID